MPPQTVQGGGAGGGGGGGTIWPGRGVGTGGHHAMLYVIYTVMCHVAS